MPDLMLQPKVDPPDIAVLKWLRTTPFSGRDHNTDAISPVVQRGIKRKRQVKGITRTDQSAALAETSGNIMHQSASRKRRLTRRSRTPSATTRYDIDGELAIDETPRQSERTMNNAPFFQSSVALPLEPSNIPDFRSAASSTASNRSRSPQETLGSSYFSNIAIDRKHLTAQTVPPELSPLWRDLSAISCGVGVIPCIVESRIKEAGILAQAHEFIDPALIPGKTASISEIESLFERLVEVWEAAMDCLNRNVAEPRWNAEVHSSLLNLALRAEWKGKGVWYEDITTARVTDRQLFAKIGSVPSSAKLVDYAIMIDSDFELKQRIARAIDTSDKSVPWSINCTAVEYMQFNPIAISIETKRESASNGDPYHQLGAWTNAHYLKLQQLTNSLIDLPAVPLISVDGHRWRFMIAVWSSKSGRYQLQILSNLTLGETSTLPGVYRVVAALQRLARWVDEDYRLWFEEKVLNKA